MTTRIVTIIALLLWVKLLHAQDYNAMRRSTNAVGTDLVAVQTNAAGAAGQRFLTTMTLDNFLTSLQGLNGWSAGGSGETNYMGDAGITNAIKLSVTYDKTGSTNRLRTISGGNGVVTTNEGTNIAVAVDLSVVASDARMDNAEAATNALNLAVAARQGASALLSNIVAAATNTVWLNISSNLPVAISNVANNTRIRLAGGTYSITPSKVLSNGVGAINLFSKTNIIIESEEDAVLDGSGALGELLYATNVNGLIIRGVTFKGMVVTNYTLASGIGHVHGSLGVYDVQHLLIKGCRFIDGHDHGIYDLGSQPNWNKPSTNNIRIRGNYFTNFGSQRTNESVTMDGTAVVPTTGWWIDGNEFYGNLRDIEPYVEGDSTGNLGYGTVITGNRFRNTIENSILSAGSTNEQFTTIAGNHFERDTGYSRRGTNIISSAAFIYWNGSHGWRIEGNDFRGQIYAGVWAVAGVRDGVISGNRFHDLTNVFGSGGIAVQLEGVYNFTVAGNDIRRGEGQSIYLYGPRDSEIARNTIVDPAGEVGIQVATFGGNTASNLWVRDNSIFGATNAIWDQALSGSQDLLFSGNRIEGHTGNAYNLGATAAGEVTIRTIDSHGGTNQFATLGNLNVASNALSSAAGGGGTNFPNVNLLAGGTNLTLSSGVRKSYHNQTNGSHGINLNLAVPESGYEVRYSVSNSGSSAITVTLYTNSVAANMYSLREKTNVNTITVPAASIVKAEFRFAGMGVWLIEDVSGPELNLVWGDGIYADTNGTSGLRVVPTTITLTNFANAATNDIDCSRPVQGAFTNDLSGNQLIRLLTPRVGTWGNVYMRDSGSARTLGVAVPTGVGSELLSTNWTSNSTNILTVASKLAVFSWEVTRGTNGTTNVSWFVTSKTP